jgi:hypothetical protein
MVYIYINIQDEPNNSLLESFSNLPQAAGGARRRVGRRIVV